MAGSTDPQRQTIDKKPMISHWRRPMLYTKRIRTIMPERGLTGFGGLAVHKSVLQTLLQSCPSKPVFPNLQELSYPTICNLAIVDEATYMKSMFMLSPPSTLQSLSFQYPSGRNAKDTRSFLTQFRNHFRTLESLRVFMGEVLPLPPYSKLKGDIRRNPSRDHRFFVFVRIHPDAQMPRFGAWSGPLFHIKTQGTISSKLRRIFGSSLAWAPFILHTIRPTATESHSHVAAPDR
jgi:hypothetical protein